MQATQGFKKLPFGTESFASSQVGPVQTLDCCFVPFFKSCFMRNYDLCILNIESLRFENDARHDRDWSCQIRFIFHGALIDEKRMSESS